MLGAVADPGGTWPLGSHFGSHSGRPNESRIVPRRPALSVDLRKRTGRDEPGRHRTNRIALSRWRHGFEPRWDYQGQRMSGSPVSTLVKVQTRASRDGKGEG